MIRLSQRHLKILETCPRQFEHTYLDRLTLPMAPAQQVKTQLGSDFHLLMQQRELGLPIEPILARSPQLNRWMTAIVATAPELFQPSSQAWRESEHVRTLRIGNYLFTVIYDLLILQPERAEIIDWKTYPLPKFKKDLSCEWQTRLYLYLLAETSNYLPKQISFTYWFIQSTPQPKSVQICYTLKQHRETHQDLLAILAKLTSWLATDLPAKKGVQSTFFPQVEIATGICQHCNFAPRCGREHLDHLAPETCLDLDFDRIPAIPI